MNIKELPYEIQNKINTYLLELEITQKKKYFANVFSELLYGFWIKNIYGIKYVFSDDYGPIKITSNNQLINIKNACTYYYPLLYLSTPMSNKWSFPREVEYEFASRVPKLISYYN